jgi:sec-independent protein translocase protein TatA
MFGSLGGSEVILIFVLALLLFGPRKLPEIGRMLGRSVAEFRKATHEFRTTLEREVQMEELKEIKDVGASLREASRLGAQAPEPGPTISSPAPHGREPGTS